MRIARFDRQFAIREVFEQNMASPSCGGTGVKNAADSGRDDIGIFHADIPRRMQWAEHAR
jgi:hypothetical protein